MTTRINIPKEVFLPIVILLMVGFLVLDQALKKIALTSLAASPVYFGDYFSLEIYKNYGIAFGLPISADVFYLIVFLFFVWLVSGKALNFKEMDKKEILAVGLILSGALGNVIDRVKFGYIVDFINVGGVIIFNMADVFIAIGVIILFEKFIPDAGKGKFDKNIYIFLFMIFGAMVSLLIHVFIEIWYINLLVLDFSKYSFGLTWSQWYFIHGIGAVILFIGGLLFGYLQGRYWWKVLYENR